MPARATKRVQATDARRTVPTHLQPDRFEKHMAKDFLKGIADEYDVVVIGSGLAGMTSANILGRAGHRVLLLEQHYKLGGLATWFLRPGGHTFDISLHGFPHGMVKSVQAILEPRHRRSNRPTEKHPVRQPTVLADDDVQPRGLHAVADQSFRDR